MFVVVFFFFFINGVNIFFFFFSSRRRHTRYWRDWSSDVCSSDLELAATIEHDPSRIVHVEHIHPQSEIAVLRCDARRAADVLQWTPRVSLEEGIGRTREWMAARLAAGMPVA